MSTPRLGEHLERLRDLFVDGYQKEDLAELLVFRMDRNLANEVAEGAAFKVVVFDLLLKALREGWLLQLARRAAEQRQERKPAWKTFVVELEGVLGTEVAPPFRELVAVPRPPAPPDELHAIVRGCDRILQEHGPDAPLDTAIDRLRTFPLGEYDLTEFVLSDSPGWRLTAILALTRFPDVRFLHWLAERVGLESPAVAYYAAVALREATAGLTVQNLDAVDRAVKTAVKYIPALVPRSDRRATLARALDLANRTLGALAEAAGTVDRRTMGRG